MKEAEYPLVIVAMEEIIEIRLKDAPPGKPGMPSKSGTSRPEGKEASKKPGKTNKGQNTA
jgi:hypothetical protein